MDTEVLEEDRLGLAEVVEAEVMVEAAVVELVDVEARVVVADAVEPRY